jgi:long-chain acyl-CoA synthetase
MGNKWNKYLIIQRYKNLADMLSHTVERYGDKAALRWFEEGVEDHYETVTYNQVWDNVKSTFGGLTSLGTKKNDMIAICSETRAEWIYADFGSTAAAGVIVAIYPSLTPAEMKYIINDSGTKAIFVDNRKSLDKILQAAKECPSLKYIFVFDKLDLKNTANNVIPFSDLIEKGKAYNTQNPKAFDESRAQVNEEDLASLIYTSGTTGIPKGTMLTHKNFLSDVTAAVAVAATLDGHKEPWKMDFLTVLPYSHSFGRCVDEYSALYIGAGINFTGGYDPKKIRRSFENFHPTIMCGIPYLYQKIYNMVNDEVIAMPPKMQKIFKSAIEVGNIYFSNRRDGKKNPLGITFKYNTIGKLVGKIVRKKLGGKLLLMISGSAAISPDLAFFFLTLGLNLLEGYGLTETSPVTHLLRPWANSDYRPNNHKKIEFYKKLGTIGPPVEIPDNPYENLEQKVTELGELLIRGPMVMKGYWNKPKETEEAIDSEGWLHTGDLAEIDEDGYARIKGRAKVIIKLSTGKIISPAVVENSVVPTSRVVAQIILMGTDAQKYITACVVPYQEPLKKFADTHGIKYTSFKDLIYNKEILNLIKEDIENSIKDVADFQHPKKFMISCAAFDINQGYLTPSYKFKRNKLFTDFKKQIEEMYNQEDEFYILKERLTDFYDQSTIIS